MRLFAEFAILILVFSLVGEFCAHTEEHHAGEAQACAVQFESDEGSCCDDEDCEHHHACACLCHVPADLVEVPPLLTNALSAKLLANIFVDGISSYSDIPDRPPLA